MDFPDIGNDLDIDFASNPEAAARVQNHRRNLRKIREVVASTTISIMNPLREGENLRLDVPVHKLTTFQQS
jgi:hypothetical protein